MRLRNSVSSASEALKWKGRIALESSLATLADVSPAIAGIVAVARASEATAVREVRFPRRDATPGVISIWSMVFILLFGLFEVLFLQILFPRLPADYSFPF